jgi:hypothetical protein
MAIGMDTMIFLSRVVPSRLRLVSGWNVPTIGLLCAIVVMGCKHSEEHTSKEHEHHHQQLSSAIPHHQKTTNIRLNDGKKLKANPETTSGITNMQRLVNKALSTKEGSLDKRKTIVKDLRSALQTIFRQCTMTGEAHEQLHHFLIPVEAMLSALEKEMQIETWRNLQSHLASYSTYFE